MFHKPFRIKSETVLKNSDRKKLKAEVGKQWPRLSPDDLSELIPSKSEIQHAKVCTHSGETVNVYFYLQQPLFFEIGSVIYPTVYTAWRYPDCIRSLATWPPVISKIMGGADLMLPGVIIPGELSPSTFAGVRSHAACGVNATGNKAAVAIGMATMSAEEMYRVGMRGKGVLIKHYYGDQLWAVGSKALPPWIEESGIPQHLANGIPDDMNALCLSESTEQEGDVEGAESEQAEQNKETEESDNDIVSTLNAMEPDERLFMCFLYAMKQKTKQKELPILASKFYKVILSCCPAGVPLEIKKTKYKKVTEFFSEMQKLNFLMMKETSPGVHNITDIYTRHKEVRNFEPWDLNLEEQSENTAEVLARYEPPVISEMLAVNGYTLPFFSKMGLQKGDPLSRDDVRMYVTDYIKANNLQSQTNKQYVELDPIFTDVLVNKSEGYVQQLTWADIMERLTKKMGHVHTILFSHGAVVTRKGLPTPIQVSIEKRTGNKVVTLINHLDKFGIDVKSFAKEIRSAKACSASITVMPSGPQVMAQGNHTAYIFKLLKDKYKIPLKYMDVPT